MKMDKNIVCMEYYTFQKIREFMITHKLDLLQCRKKVYLYNKDSDALKCVINNKEHTIQCGYELQDLESITKEMESIEKDKSEKDYFKHFVEDCFQKDSIEHTLNHYVVREIWNEWKKHNCKLCPMKLKDVYELMKEYCGNDSNTERFIGIKQIDALLTLMP